MPDESWWNTFFDPPAILRSLGLDRVNGPVIDVGCGYGTFTLAIARTTPHTVIALDIEPDLVAEVGRRARDQELAHVSPRVLDVWMVRWGSTRTPPRWSCCSTSSTARTLSLCSLRPMPLYAQAAASASSIGGVMFRLRVARISASVPRRNNAEPGWSMPDSSLIKRRPSFLRTTLAWWEGRTARAIAGRLQFQFACP